MQEEKRQEGGKIVDTQTNKTFLCRRAVSLLLKKKKKKQNAHIGDCVLQEYLTTTREVHI